MTAAVIIFRDRVTYARKCVGALLSVGLDVHIVDHGSTWPAATEWLRNCDVPVHYRDNDHPQRLWYWDGLRRIVGNKRYVVTDPDVVPDEECPMDWVDHLHNLLDQHTDRVKIGLNLRIDDLPACYEHADDVRRWELQHNAVLVSPNVYGAAVDTTLALYVPLTQFSAFALGPAFRTTPPYTAKHLTWYQDSDNLTDEEKYYAAHAMIGASHWNDPTQYH